MLKFHKPQMIFLIETKLNKQKKESVRKRYSYINGFDINVDGKRGGHCLAWREEVQVSLISFSINSIDVKIEGSEEEGVW